MKEVPEALEMKRGARGSSNEGGARGERDARGYGHNPTK